MINRILSLLFSFFIQKFDVPIFFGHLINSLQLFLNLLRFLIDRCGFGKRSPVLPGLLYRPYPQCLYRPHKIVGFSNFLAGSPIIFDKSLYFQKNLQRLSKPAPIGPFAQKPLSVYLRHPSRAVCSLHVKRLRRLIRSAESCTCFRLHVHIERHARVR